MLFGASLTASCVRPETYEMIDWLFVRCCVEGGVKEVTRSRWPSGNKQKRKLISARHRGEKILTTDL